MITINGIKIEGDCISISDGEIKISTGNNIKISTFKEKEIHIHGDVGGNVDGTYINVEGDVKGDVDGTMITINGSANGNIDGTNIRVNHRMWCSYTYEVTYDGKTKNRF